MLRTKVIGILTQPTYFLEDKKT